MTDELHLAFAHPDARAEASAGAPPSPDRISVRDYVRDVEIGAFQAERGTTQRIRFNVVVEVTGVSAADTDDVDQILSYDRITEAIDGVLTEERLNLLETLAERVAERILTERQAARVFLRIEKMDRGPFVLGVEIERRADTVSATPDAPPRPRILHLGADAVTSGGISERLDRWTGDGAPLVLTVGAMAVPVPRASAPMAQRRIDLLALEQAAWVVAGQDRRCIVVDTRTELDWGLRNGQISVWAPSKIVLDAADGPTPDPRDEALLLGWFAGQMDAREIVTVGGPDPQTDIPVIKEPI